MNQIKKRVLCTLSFLLLAFSVTSYTNERQSLEEFTSSALNTLTLKNFTKEQFQEIMPVTKNTLRILIGSHWKNFDDSQKERFIVAFENYFFNLIRANSSRIESYKRTSIPIRKFKSKINLYSISYSYSTTSSRSETITFVVALKDNGWEILDIITDGTSWIKRFRDTWEREIKEGGIENFLINLEKGSFKKETSTIMLPLIFLFL